MQAGLSPKLLKKIEVLEIKKALIKPPRSSSTFRLQAEATTYNLIPLVGSNSDKSYAHTVTDGRQIFFLTTVGQIPSKTGHKGRVFLTQILLISDTVRANGLTAETSHFLHIF